MAPVTDEKAVFATIETANVVPARARAGGTIAELKVRQGDHVEQGQVIAAGRRSQARDAGACLLGAGAGRAGAACPGQS